MPSWRAWTIYMNILAHIYFSVIFSLITIQWIWSAAESLPQNSDWCDWIRFLSSIVLSIWVFWLGIIGRVKWSTIIFFLTEGFWWLGDDYYLGKFILIWNDSQLERRASQWRSFASQLFEHLISHTYGFCNNEVVFYSILSDIYIISI